MTDCCCFSQLLRLSLEFPGLSERSEKCLLCSCPLLICNTFIWSYIYKTPILPMDPVSAFGTFASGLQIAQVITQTIGGLATLRGRFKNADLTIRSLIGELTTIKSAITQLDDWAKYNSHGSSNPREYNESLDVALEGCRAIMEVLSEEVSALMHGATDDNMAIGFKTRMRVVWNDEVMKDHQARLHSQVLALQLLLQACQW